MHQYAIGSMILSAALRLMRIDHLDAAHPVHGKGRVEGDYLAVRDFSLDEMASFAPVFDVLVAHPHDHPSPPVHELNAGSARKSVS